MCEKLEQASLLKCRLGPDGPSWEGAEGLWVEGGRGGDTWTVAVVAQVCTFIKPHCIPCLQWVQAITCSDVANPIDNKDII